MNATTRDAVLAALSRAGGDWLFASRIADRHQLDRAEVVAALRQLAAEGQAVRDVHENADGLTERWRVKWTPREEIPTDVVGI